MIGVLRIDRAERGGGRISAVRVPNECERDPIGIGRTTLFEQARFDAHACDRKLLPNLGALGEGPLIHVARVDLRAVRQKQPALFLAAVTPQRKARREGRDTERELARRDVGVEARL